MLSSEFASKLASFSLQNHLQGIFAADNLPRNIKKDHFIICNTDVIKGKGQHWYCILKIENNVLECFDSLGIDQEKKVFLQKNFNYKNITKIKFNVTQVQSSISNTCGLFVLYFVIQRFYNKDVSFTGLLNEVFVKNPEENEKTVTNFFIEN